MRSLHDCRKAFSDTLVGLAAADPRVVAVVNDSVGSSNLKEFKKRFPDRMVNVGIAEQNMAMMSTVRAEPRTARSTAVTTSSSRSPNPARAAAVSRWLFAGQALASIGFIVYSAMVRNAVFVTASSLILVAAIIGQLLVFSGRRRDRRQHRWFFRRPRNVQHGRGGSRARAAHGPSARFICLRPPRHR